MHLYPIMSQNVSLHLHDIKHVLYFSAENKLSIRNANVMDFLLPLEQFMTSPDLRLREVSFCAQWCLDNLCKY